MNEDHQTKQIDRHIGHHRKAKGPNNNTYGNCKYQYCNGRQQHQYFGRGGTP